MLPYLQDRPARFEHMNTLLDVLGVSWELLEIMEGLVEIWISIYKWFLQRKKYQTNIFERINEYEPGGNIDPNLIS